MPMSPEEYDKAYAGIAIAHKICSQEILRDAFKAQAGLKAKKQWKPLAEILMEQGKVSKSHHQAIERAVKYRLQREDDKMLGQIMIVSDYAPEKVVVEALEEQKALYSKTGETKTLEELLIAQGAITADHALAAKKIRKLKMGVS